jgi:transcriptional regulator with GAF, ATPase, and Fis domain
VVGRGVHSGVMSRPESWLRSFSSVPLDQVISEVTTSLQRMPLAELEALVLGSSGSGTGAGAGAPESGAQGRPLPSLETFAHGILALPTRGSKLAEAERSVVTHALQVTDGNVSAAARLLGVDRKALERKIARYKRRG